MLTSAIIAARIPSRNRECMAILKDSREASVRNLLGHEATAFLDTDATLLNAAR
jgi:hypothetical protein